MKRVDTVVATKIEAEKKSTITQFAQAHYDGNLSMATRRIIDAGMRTLGLWPASEGAQDAKQAA